ncbi:MAG: carboxypeptidase-like regulatory domain-containing protein, partial [Candidatus Angelobacter sp.]
MRYRWLRFCALVLFISAVTVNRAAAQVNTVNLSGIVLDPQGLAVAGATVTLANSGTGALRSVTTDSSGRYGLVG